MIMIKNQLMILKRKNYFYGNLSKTFYPINLALKFKSIKGDVLKQFKGSLTIYRILLLFISIGIYFVGLLTENPKWIFYSIMFLWGGIVLYIIQNTSKRAALLIFQIAFFNFLLGGTFLN